MRLLAGRVGRVVFVRPVESHSGALGNILAGPPKLFLRGPTGDTIFEFFFKMVHFGVLYISERWRGPQTSRGPG